MIGRPFHPSLRRLGRFVDGELEGPVHARIRAHLARCYRCQARVREFRGLARALRGMPAVEPPAALRDQILAAAKSGIVAILPEPPAGAADAPVRAGPRGLRPIGIGAALLLLAVTGALALAHTRSLDVHFPALQLAPDGPRPGTPLALRFTGASHLGGGGQLTVRAELFDADGGSRVITTPLERSPVARAHQGNLSLPPDIVYAVLAVEDTSGERVESNAGRLWEVVVHDADGRPSHDGLRQRAARHFRIRPDLALEAAQAMVEHHPERAESWGTLYATEELMTGPASSDELAGRHRPHFDRLESRFETVPPTSADLAAMTLYARRVADPATQERWEARLLREAPGERLAIQLRLQELQAEHGGDPARLLEEHERFWAEAGPDRDLAASGLAVAERLGDHPATIRWADRLVAVEPGERVAVAERLAGRSGTRFEGVGRLRAELRALEGPADPDTRPPGESAGERRAAEQRTRARLLAALGKALIEVGRIETGTHTLLLASELVWDPELFRTAAGSLLARGDTLTAVPLLARIFVDPETRPTERGELARLGGEHLGHGAWAASLRDAEARMRTLVFAEARSRRLPPEIRVEDLEGRSHDLRSLLGGEVAVLSLWYCVCEQFQTLIDRHRALAAELFAEGIPLFTVVARPPAPDGWGATVDLELVSPVLMDAEGVALQAFASARTPAYFVVDADGTVRFSDVSADEIRRLVLVLVHQEGPPAVTLR